MKIVNREEFDILAGASMPAQRNMNTFSGDRFRCACGGTHTFGVDNIQVIAEGMNGKFIIQCPNDNNLVIIIKTKMKWGMLYQGLEFIAGTRE